MRVIRINSKNVVYIILAILSTSVKEAQHMSYESIASYALRDANTNSTPAYNSKKEECLKCNLNPNSVYGVISYKVNCTVLDQVDCIGELFFEKTFICRYCYHRDPQERVETQIPQAFDWLRVNRNQK